MKRSVKILCLLLALAMLTALFAACNKKKGEIIAVYNNTPVYESEVDDIVNYQVGINATLTMSSEEVKEIVRNAVKTYVQYKVLEIDLKKKGYEVDEKLLKELVQDSIDYLNENFEGGYSDWRNMYHVSKNFLKEDVRRYLLADLFNQYAQETTEVTEEEMRRYYNANGMAYADYAGYTWTATLREVKDIADETECGTALSEMNEYIRQINAGIMTFDQVKPDLLKKYTEEDGYTQTSLFSGENFTSADSMKTITNLSEALDAVRAQYSENGELDPNAAAGTDAYVNYRNYLGACFQTEVYYAIQHMQPGEVYGRPIRSFIGYFIIRLDSIKTQNGFIPFEDVKDEIRQELLANKITTMFEDHMEQLESDYEVSYLFDAFVPSAS